MTFREIIAIFVAGLIVSSCHLNLNAPDDGDGGNDPDSSANYQIVDSNLPSGLDGNSQKAKAADIDNDGDLDLVIAISQMPNKVLINDGSGNFADESNTRLPAQNYDSQDVTAADFNNDGYLDLFFVGNQNETNELYINDGGGSFGDLTNRIPVTGNSTAVEALDIDGDGPIDIMIGNIGQNVILINGGNAFFNNQTVERLPQINDQTQDLAFGDITGDNLRDIIVANVGSNLVLVNTGVGFFDSSTGRIPPINAVEETRDINIADVDGDGDRDLYLGNSGAQQGSSPQDRLLINDGSGFFSDVTTDQLPTITPDTYDAEFGDLDNDGDFDLVVGNYNGGLRVLLNDGNGTFTDQTGTWIPEGFAPFVADIEIANLNDDNLLDIYIAVRNGQDQLLLQKDS